MESKKESAFELSPWPEDFVNLYRQQGYWKGECLAQLLETSAGLYPENIALIEGDKKLSYQQLQARVEVLAMGLRARGIGYQDKVVLQLPNSIEFFEVLFALFSIGAVPVMALAAHRLFEIENFCRLAKAKAYIVDGKTKQFDYLTLAEQVRDLALVDTIIVNDDQNNLADGFVSLSSCFNIEENLPKEPVSPKASDMALLQLSGGTTNLSKLIPRTHDDYFYSIRESARICHLSKDDVYLVALPAAHNFPLTSPGSLGALYAGATVVLTTTGAPDVCFPLIEKHKVTISSLVPPLAIAWLNGLPASGSRDFSSLRLLQVGGAKLSHSVAKKIRQHFPATLQQVFGMAEGLVNYTRLDDSEEVVLSTQGRPISPHDEIKIVDENDEEVAPGEYGQLLTRGPYTIRGYYCAQEHNQRAFTSDGFYRTGDVVKQTEHGYLTVEGRAKDQINRGGEKIAAEEIENLLLTHPVIHDCALVSMPDDYLGERSCAFVICRDSQRLSGKVLRKFLKEKHLADYKIPDRFEFVNDFPKTKFGKVNKQTLRNTIAETMSAISA